VLGNFALHFIGGDRQQLCHGAVKHVEFISVFGSYLSGTFIAFTCIILLIQSSKSKKQGHTVIDKQDGNNQEGTAGQQTPSSRPDFPLPKSLGTGNQAIHRTEPTEPSSNNAGRATKDLDSIRIAEWWLIGIQVCVLITGIVVCIIYGKQLTIMQGQLSVMDRQLSEMEDSGKQTDRIIAADERLAKAMEDNVANEKEALAQSKKISDKNLAQSKSSLEAAIALSRSDQRAWVGATEIRDLNFSVGELTKYSVRVRNTGKSPALHVTVEVAGQYVPRGEKVEFVYPPLSTFTSNATVQPGVITSVTTVGPVALNQTQVNALKSGESVIYLYGKIRYQDVFRVVHHATFCFVVETDLRSADSCDRYNDAD
jgi:hypothetical protein